jgi:hypothetical protein
MKIPYDEARDLLIAAGLEGRHIAWLSYIGSSVLEILVASDRADTIKQTLSSKNFHIFEKFDPANPPARNSINGHRLTRDHMEHMKSVFKARIAHILQTRKAIQVFLFPEGQEQTVSDPVESFYSSLLKDMPVQVGHVEK